MTAILTERELTAIKQAAEERDDGTTLGLARGYRVLKCALVLATKRLVGSCPPRMTLRGPGCGVPERGSEACADCHMEDVLRRAKEALDRV